MCAILRRVVGLIFELIEWTIKLMIIVLVVAARLFVAMLKALLIVTAFVIAAVAASMQQRRNAKGAAVRGSAALAIAGAPISDPVRPKPDTRTLRRSAVARDVTDGRPLPFPPHPKSVAPRDAERKSACPECGETVVGSVRICRHCGYRPL